MLRFENPERFVCDNVSGHNAIKSVQKREENGRRTGEANKGKKRK